MFKPIQTLACVTAIVALSTSAQAGLFGTVNDFDTAGSTQTPYVVGTNGYTPATVAGGATGQVLQLTDGGGSEATRAGFNQTASLTQQTYFGTAPVVLIDFDFRAQPSNNQADGLYLALLRVADEGSTGAGPQLSEDPFYTSGSGPVFAIGLDIFNNGGPNDSDDNHISLHYGNVFAVGGVPFDISTSQFHHAQVRLDFRADGSGADVSVTLQENALGMNTAASGGLVTYGSVFFAGLTPYDYRVGVGARTGGFTAVQQFDNLNVKNGAHAFAYAADFSARESDFTLVGSAAFRTDTGGGSYQQWLNLTDTGGSKTGSAWLTEKQSVAGGFTTDFQWRLNFPSGGGADGLAFIIQNVDTTQNPGEGGIANNALSIVFDTYGAGDPNYEHLVVKDGWTDLADVDLAGFGFDFDADPGANQYAGRYDVRIDYLPGELDIYLNGVLVVSNLAVDLGALANGSAVDGLGYAWLGFTARTGGSTENHDILNWHFASFVIPTPAALPAGLALLAVAATRRSRRH